MVILVDRLDRVADAVVISKRARAIAVQSVVAGMALSGIAMGFAAYGWLSPVAGALIQEGIDVAVILNALRALVAGRQWGRTPMPAAAALALREEHEELERKLNRLREIADALDDADVFGAVALIAEADRVGRGARTLGRERCLSEIGQVARRRTRARRHEPGASGDLAPGAAA